MSDETQVIIHKILAGDQSAFKQLYDQYAALVYNTALSYTQDTPDAEEVTQDVFLKIHKNLKSFKGQSTFSTWVYRIAINTSLNKIRSRKTNRTVSMDLATEQISFIHPGVLLENKEDSIALFKAIKELPETQQTAFIMSYIEHLPRKEVAEIMTTSLKAVESLLQRAKRNLRNQLEIHYPNRRNK